MSAGVEGQGTDEPKQLDIAGFWRRTLAFVLDMIILGIAGLIAGATMFNALASLGSLGRLVGFFIAGAYFVVLTSRVSKGQTPGQMALSLRTVGADGNTLSLKTALARYVIWGVPYFANGMQFGVTGAMFWVAGVLAAVVGLVGFLGLYLYICNRRTRQSLADLLVGSYVVRVDRAEPGRVLLPVWRGHWIAVGCVLVALVTGGALVAHWLGGNALVDLRRTYETVASQPHVRTVNVTQAKNYVNGVTSEIFSARVELDAPLVNDETLAKSLAHTIASSYPGVATDDAVVISLAYGYDLGFAHGWSNHFYRFTPNELQ